MMARWELWRGDTPEQQMRNAARDLDDFEKRQDRHDEYHRDRQKDETAWRAHVDDEIEGLKKILFGFIVSAAGIIIVAAINVAVLIVKGG